MKVFLTVVFVFAYLSTVYSVDTYEVGLARVDITPKGPIRMAGYGSKSSSVGVILNCEPKLLRLAMVQKREGTF